MIMYEEGGRIRRSSESSPASTVDGFGWIQYEMDFTRFLVFGQASDDERKEYPDVLFETGSLKKTM